MHLSNQQLCSKVFSHEIFPECDPTACLWVTAIPFTTARVWLGQGGGGTKYTQKIPNTRGLCRVCVCVFGVPQGLVFQRLALHPAGIKALGSRTVPGVQVCHISSWILPDPGEGKKETHPRDSEVTPQDPIEKGVLQQLGFPLVVFL